MRVNKLVSLMKERNFNGALISPGTNLYYLTSLHIHEAGERLTVLAVNSNGDYHFLAPSLYENVVQDFPVTFWRDGENPYEKLAQILKELDLLSGRILVENTMRADWVIGILRLGNFEFHPLSILMRELRMIKDAREIKLMKNAAQVVDEVFYELIERDLEGMSEKQVVALIEHPIKERSDGISFEPIVAAGENGANPHHAPGGRKLRKGDLVILDYGARWKGYCSDITRTIAIGKPSALALDVYNVVKEAQEKAVQAVREGITAREIDAVARGEITKKGYGGYFIHRTGHGLGLDVHEEPYIAQNSWTVLEEGMTFTIEPGIYIPGRVGVRIEDDVAIINGKGRRLTEAERELIQL